MSTSEHPRPVRRTEWERFARLLLSARAALHSAAAGNLWSRDLQGQLLGVGRPWRNWAGNQKATPEAWVQPTSEAEVQAEIDLAGRMGRKVRVLGRGYSFSPLVPTDQHLLDTSLMDDVSVAASEKTVTAGPGTTIARLHHELRRKRLCLETATVIPWITVSGALGTGAHGTGRHFGTLSDLVVEARAVDGSGQVRVVAGPRSGKPISDEWRALGCNLGALGVITQVTFQAVDLFNLQAKDDTRNHWFETTMLRREGLRGLLEAADYVSALWWPGTERCWVKTWKRTLAKPTRFEVQYFLDQLGIWLGAGVVTEIGELLAHHPSWTPIFTSMVFDQIQHQEYVSPAPDVFHFITQYPMVWDMSYAFDVEGYADAGIDRVVCAWRALVETLEGYRGRGLFPQNMAAHMRHLHSSHSLLSPSTGHNGSVALEVVTLQGDESGVWSRFFADVEARWLGLGGRPHWGKVHGWGDAGGEPHNTSKLRDILRSYGANVEAFRDVRRAWDQNHLFQNDYTAALQL